MFIGLFILHSEFSKPPPPPLTYYEEEGGDAEFCDAPSTKESLKDFFQISQDLLIYQLLRLNTLPFGLYLLGTTHAVLLVLVLAHTLLKLELVNQFCDKFCH